MPVYTDCPAILSQWREFADESAEVEALDGVAAEVWRAFAGDRPAWEIDTCEAGPADGLVVVVEHAEESQFDRLHELARSGTDLPPLVAAMALHGENFHGQGQRPWRAEKGNLHLSVGCRTDVPAAGALAAISVLPTLAVMDAFDIAPEPAVRTGIRWLNDVFVRGRKLAGSIAASEIEGDRIQQVLFGIGVNVETVPAVPGDVFVPEATSLRAAFPEGDWTLGRATFALLRALTARVAQLTGDGMTDLVRDYTERSACVGREVKVWPKRTEDAAVVAPIAAGRMLAIDDSLAVRVAGASPLAEGRLAFLEDCEALGL